MSQGDRSIDQLLSKSSNKIAIIIDMLVSRNSIPADVDKQHKAIDKLLLILN